MGTRFGGIVTRDTLEVPLEDIGQFVTHQELQRYENERYRIELEAENAKKHLGRPSKSRYLFADDIKASSSRSPERCSAPSKKPRGRPRKAMLFISSSDTEPVNPKGPRGRPKKLLTFAEESSIDELDQPTTFNTITVQIPSKTKIKVDAIRSNMPSVISPPAKRSKRPSPTMSPVPKQDTIEETMHRASTPEPDLIQRNPTLPSKSHPPSFSPKTSHKSLAPGIHPFQRKRTSLPTTAADGSSRPSIISSASSSHESYESCSSPSKPDLQRPEKQSSSDAHRQNIHTTKNKPAEHHTLSHPLEDESPNTSFVTHTEYFAEASNNDPLNKTLKPQRKLFDEEDAIEGVSLLQQFQAPIPPSRKISPSSAPAANLSHRPAPWFQKDDRLQMSENPSLQDYDPGDFQMEGEEDAISLLQQFQAPIPLPLAHTEVSAQAQLPSHSHRPTPSLRTTPASQDSPKRYGSLSMTPHYPSRKSIAKLFERQDRRHEGGGRKRKRVKKGVVVKMGREESMEL